MQALLIHTRQSRLMMINFIFFLAITLFSLPVLSSQDSGIQLQVGEVKIIEVPDVARVAVGDGHVLNAITTDEKEVIIFARNEGNSTVHIWSEIGLQKSISVDVVADGTRQTQKELKSLLEKIPNVRIQNVGNKLLVEGDNLSDSDLKRLADLSSKYPQLLDFTGKVGWDSMVLLDVQVLELPRTTLTELGIRWNSVSEGGPTVGLAWDGGSSRVLDRPGATVVPAIFPTINASGYYGINALFSAHINALKQTGVATVLAQPQLMARSGSAAEFLAGGEVPYSTTDANGNVNTEFKPYGVSLRITPQIERNNNIRSRIEVEVSSVDTTYSVSNGPALKTRRAATEFNVESGQTLVLAGFISRESAKNVDSVPVLGQIPLFGELFRSRRFQNNETELAIFVTPTVISSIEASMQRRVSNANSIINDEFPTPYKLNTHIQYEPDISLVNQSDKWDPWKSAGSQWLQSSN